MCYILNHVSRSTFIRQEFIRLQRNVDIRLCCYSKFFCILNCSKVYFKYYNLHSNFLIKINFIFLNSILIIKINFIILTQFIKNFVYLIPTKYVLNVTIHIQICLLKFILHLCLITKFNFCFWTQFVKYFCIFISNKVWFKCYNLYSNFNGLKLASFLTEHSKCFHLFNSNKVYFKLNIVYSNLIFKLIFFQHNTVNVSEYLFLIK